MRVWRSGISHFLTPSYDDRKTEHIAERDNATEKRMTIFLLELKKDLRFIR